MEKTLAYLKEIEFEKKLNDSLGVFYKLGGGELSEEGIRGSVKDCLRELADVDEKFKEILFDEFFDLAFPKYMDKLVDKLNIVRNEDVEIDDSDRLAFGIAMVCSAMGINPAKIFNKNN